MQIGPYQLDPIETGRFALDGGAMFGIVPRTLWAKTNPADDRNRITLAARALLIRGEGRTILVDNGNGTKFSEKLIDIYRLDMSRYNLLTSLRACGIGPDDVTDVLLTHLHFDHAGGSTTRDANGVLRPTFPNARYYVQKAHWEHSQAPTERDRASFMPDDYMPLMQAGVLELIDGERDVFPYIDVVLVNGHTTAQQLPRISDGKTTVLYCCDLFPTTSHIPLPYIMAYDLRPLVTLEDKKRLLHRANAERWVLFFEHDPETAAGTVKLTEKGYSFDAAVEMETHPPAPVS